MNEGMGKLDGGETRAPRTGTARYPAAPVTTGPAA